MKTIILFMKTSIVLRILSNYQMDSNFRDNKSEQRFNAKHNPIKILGTGYSQRNNIEQY